MLVFIWICNAFKRGSMFLKLVNTQGSTALPHVTCLHLDFF